MSGAIVNAAVFAAGALLGGGVAAAVVSSQQKKRELIVIPPTPAPSAPLVSVSPSGNAHLTSGGISALALSPAMRYGNPGPISDPLVRKAYVAAYDRRLRHPAWTAEHLTIASLAKQGAGGDRGKSQFVEDTSIPEPFRAKLSDYFRSGYDRGHMVPAADAKATQEAMNETFFLSNMAPQVGDGFNRHYWAYLENWCRTLTNSFSDVYVFTVPLYLPRKDTDGKFRVTHEVIGNPPNIAVPTHFAKVVMTSRPASNSNILELSLGAFVLPNAIIPDDVPLESFVVPVEAVERAAGLTLFSDEVKKASQHICQTTKCQLLVRRFDDAQKGSKQKAIAAPKH